MKQLDDLSRIPLSTSSKLLRDEGSPIEIRT